MRALRIWFVLIVTFWLSGCCTSMCVRDIAPNTSNGTSQAGSSTAGLTYDLAGDDGLLYALSLNAGLFRSRNGGPWVQLAHSPSMATKVLADPFNPQHLFVGERNSDAEPTRLVRAGLWESSDAGDTWKLILEPARHAACQADNLQAVPAILMNVSTNTVFAGTGCGIARRKAGATDFDYTESPQDIGPVTAFASSFDSSGLSLPLAPRRS